MYDCFTSSRRQNGHSWIELLLFTPLAIIFLSVVIDAGAAMLERAAVADALRAGLLGANEHSAQLMALDESFHAELDDDRLQQLVANTAVAIAEGVATAKGRESFVGATDFRVTVSAIPLEVEAESGVVNHIDGALATAVLPSQTSFSLEDHAPGFPIHSAEQFLMRQISLGGQRPSPFSLPTAQGYEPRTVLFYGEVVGVTNSRHPALLRQLLGRAYAVQEQQLLVLRRQR